MPREIKIEITPEGMVRGDIAGFKGKECRRIAEILAKIVGDEVSFEPSSEYFQTEVDLGIDIETDR